MNLKKTYVEKYGYERVITDRNSPLTFTELDFLMLADGQSYTVTEKGKEFALMILYGKCNVKGDGFEFNAGKRQNVFDQRNGFVKCHSVDNEHFRDLIEDHGCRDDDDP